MRLDQRGHQRCVGEAGKADADQAGAQASPDRQPWRGAVGSEAGAFSIHDDPLRLSRGAASGDGGIIEALLDEIMQQFQLPSMQICITKESS
ncbi:hypothetical protein ACFSHR_00995 [Azotobacter chroococcum]